MEVILSSKRMQDNATADERKSENFQNPIQWRSLLRVRYTTYDRMWGKSSSILLPVFLKICNAASATFSSSIFKQARRDSKVSAEWNEIGCVNESTCQNMMKAMLTFFKGPLILGHFIKSHFPLPYWNIYNTLPGFDSWSTFLLLFFSSS